MREKEWGLALEAQAIPSALCLHPLHVFGGLPFTPLKGTPSKG